MDSEGEDYLMRAAGQVGSLYGLSATDVIAHLLLGERRHGDARPGECGVVSPRNERLDWCRRPEGHQGDHDPVASPEEVCGVLLNPPDRYDYCTSPIRHAGECAGGAR